jgi:hypothetical protein
MSPREPKTMEERMLLVEYKQEQQEREVSELHCEINDVKEIAVEAKDAVIQVSGQIALLPSQVIEAIETKNKKKKLDAKEWSSFFILIVVSAISIIDRFF